jgi:hypothetical protein
MIVSDFDWKEYYCSVAFIHLPIRFRLLRCKRETEGWNLSAPPSLGSNANKIYDITGFELILGNEIVGEKRWTWTLYTVKTLLLITYIIVDIELLATHFPLNIHIVAYGRGERGRHRQAEVDIHHFLSISTFMNTYITGVASKFQLK